MAAGIIDHETGTRDMRRLGGLWRAMPITGTLAIVASAAMAGVPLLNGFISKEMFFAEAAETYDSSLLDRSMTWVALVAEHLLGRLLDAPHAQRVLRPGRHRPARGAARAAVPHAPPGRGPRRHLPSRRHPAGPHHRAVPARRRRFRSSGRRRPTTASRSGTASTCRCHERRSRWPAGSSLYLALAARSPARAATARRSCARLKGQRIFERLLVNVSWIWARRLRPARHRAAADAAARPGARGARGGGLVALGRAAPAAGRPAAASIPLFAAVWTVGGGLRARRGLAGEIPPLRGAPPVGGAGLMTCVSFVWLSAPDLAVTQLLVEVVTTVLLLLGLRWLPKRLEEIAGDDRRSAPARAAAATSSSPSHCGLGMAGIAYAVMTSPPDRGIARLVPPQRLRRGRRHQRGERDPRRLPRLRHLRRDHRARHRRAHDLRAAPPLPPGPGEHRPPRAAAAAGRRRHRARGPQRRRHRRATISPCRRSSCAGCSPSSSRSRPICSCAATTCRAAASPRDHARHRLHAAIPGPARAWVEDRLRILPMRWIGARPARRGADRHRLLALRLSVPDVLRHST